MAAAKVLERLDELLHRPRRAIEALDDDRRKRSARGVGQQPAELGTVLLGSRRHIGIRGHEGPPTQSDVLPDLSELDFKILMLGADSGIRGDAYRVHAVQVCARECWSGRTRTRSGRGLPLRPAELR